MADTTRRVIDIGGNAPRDLGLADIGGNVYAEKVHIVNAADIGGGGAYATQIDDAGGGVTYIGRAAVGSAASSAVWQIQRITVASGDTSVEWADGDALFDNAWTGRAGLTYS